MSCKQRSIRLEAPFFLARTYKSCKTKLFLNSETHKKSNRCIQNISCVILPNIPSARRAPPHSEKYLIHKFPETCESNNDDKVGALLNE